MRCSRLKISEFSFLNNVKKRKTYMLQGENSSWQKELPVDKKKWWFGITPKTKVFFLMTPPKGCHWSDRPTWCHRPWRSITKRWPDDLHLLGCSKQKSKETIMESETLWETRLEPFFFTWRGRVELAPWVHMSGQGQGVPSMPQEKKTTARLSTLTKFSPPF